MEIRTINVIDTIDKHGRKKRFEIEDKVEVVTKFNTHIGIISEITSKSIAIAKDNGTIKSVAVIYLENIKEITRLYPYTPTTLGDFKNDNK